MSAHRSAIGGDGPMLIGIGSLLTVLAVTVVALRGYAASHSAGRWRWDFIWVCASTLTGLLASGFFMASTAYGLGNDVKNLTFTQIFTSMKWTWITIFVGLIATTLAKFSCVALLMMVQSPTAKKRRIALWSISILFGVINVIQIFLSAFQCSPAERLWNRTLPGNCSRGRIAGNWSYLQGSIGAATDVALALWPISIAWNLQTTTRVKLGFCLLMAVGMLPAIASALRIRALPAISGAKNITRDLTMFMLWCVVEFWSIVILTSIPVLRPLFLRVVYGVKRATYGAGTSGDTGVAGMTRRTGNNTAVSHGGLGMEVGTGRKRVETLSMSVLDPEKDGSQENVLANDVAAGIFVAREYDVRESQVEDRRL